VLGPLAEFLRLGHRELPNIIKQIYLSAYVRIIFSFLFVFALGLLGGILALKRKVFPLAIIGMAILMGAGLSIFGPTAEIRGLPILGLLILVLTILSIIFTSVSYREFM
jgi:hypothetical protein